jgi:hypothetical protein
MNIDEKNKYEKKYDDLQKKYDTLKRNHDKLQKKYNDKKCDDEKDQDYTVEEMTNILHLVNDALKKIIVIDKNKKH